MTCHRADRSRKCFILILANFLRRGPVKILPPGPLEGILTWPFLMTFISIGATVLLKGFWIAILVERFGMMNHEVCLTESWNKLLITNHSVILATGVWSALAYYGPNIALVSFHNVQLVLMCAGASKEGRSNNMFYSFWLYIFLDLDGKGV